MRATKHVLLMVVVCVALVIAGCPGEQDTVDMEPDILLPTEVQPVDVQLGEWYVMLVPSMVEAGEIRFDILNEGEMLHAVTIEGEGIEERSENISPGESTSMTVSLSAGAYDVYCPIEDHRERGMETLLTVE